MKTQQKYLICLLLLCLTIYFYNSKFVINTTLVASLTDRFASLTDRFAQLPCESPVRTYITANPYAYSRVGNHMFIYAALLAFQNRRCNITLAVTRNSAKWMGQMSSVFKLNTTSSKSVDILLNTATFREQATMKYDTRFETLPTTTNYSLLGYYQSWKYFRYITSQVKSQFQFHNCILDAAKKSHSQLNGCSPVCIHIRNAREYGQAPMEYINRAMNYFKEKYTDKKLTFVIVTDNTMLAWKNFSGTPLPVLNTTRPIFSVGHLCGDAANFDHLRQTILYGEKKYHGSDIVFSYDHTAAEDLAILSLCPYNVITTGTFGWWGAYLSGGEAVYWKLFPKPGTRLYERCNKADYYLPHWIPLA